MAQEGGNHQPYHPVRGGDSQQRYVACPHQSEGVTVQRKAYPLQPQGAYLQGSSYHPPPTLPYLAKPDTYQVAPPPYGQPGHTEANVVIAQPTSKVVKDKSRSQPELGIGATVFAAVSTFFVAVFFCWWALPFTIIGIILGVTAASYAFNGDVKTSKKHFIVSVCLSVTGITVAVIGAITIITVVVVRVRAAIQGVQHLSSQ